MVDFDDAIDLPFQIELLQGLISLRLVAREKGLVYDRGVDNALLDGYSAGLASDPSVAATSLRLDALFAKLLTRADEPYDAELQKFCDERGEFRSCVRKKSGQVTEILRSLDESRFDAFATAIADASKNEPALGARFRSGKSDARAIRARIRSVAQRTRIDSSGSQGLEKYLVRLKRPFEDVDGDVILYLKRSIPAAAERAGYVPRLAMPAGRRVERMIGSLTTPRPVINSCTMLDGNSFWVSLKEPWSDELDHEDVQDVADLLQLATVWGRVAGLAHRRFDCAKDMDDALATTLANRADDYVLWQAEWFRAFTVDFRTVHAIEVAERPVESAGNGVPRR